DRGHAQALSGGALLLLLLSWLPLALGAHSLAALILGVLLLDLDVQPTLSSYYELTQRAPGGIYELLAFNER
ncbi:hypothetical protein ACLBPX_33165, partial [Klebsiella pneumoniae]